MARRLTPVMGAAVPGRAGHRALRRVDGHAMEGARSGVAHVDGRDVACEIPGGAQARLRRTRGPHGREGADLVDGKRAVGEARRLDLAVEEPRREAARHRSGPTDGADAHGRGRQGADRREATGLETGRPVEAARGQRRLAQEDLAGRRVEAGRDMMPASKRHLRAGRNSRPVGEMERERAHLVHDQREPGSALPLHQRGQDRLRRPSVEHRLHQRHDGEGRQPRHRVAALDQNEGSRRNGPQRGAVTAIERRVDVAGLETRTLGSGIGTDHTHELGRVVARPRHGTDTETDGAAGRDAPVVAIAEHVGDGQIAHDGLPRSIASGWPLAASQRRLNTAHSASAAEAWISLPSTTGGLPPGCLTASA